MVNRFPPIANICTGSLQFHVKNYLALLVGGYIVKIIGNCTPYSIAIKFVISA